MSEQAMKDTALKGFSYHQYSQNPLQQFAAYLKSATTDLFRTASRASVAEATQAKVFKSHVDPVIHDLGEAAKAASGLIAIPAAITGNKELRKAYVETANISNRTSAYENGTSSDIDRKLSEAAKTVDQIRSSVERVAAKPVVDNRSSPTPRKRKKKKKKVGYRATRRRK
jgi:hypothetical protein